MRWIIQKDIFGEETEKLCEHLKDFFIIKDIKEYSSIVRNTPVVLRGSIDFVKKASSALTSNKIMFPITLTNYDCHKYYQFLEKANILNSDFLILPWWSLSDFNTDIFHTDKIFIRPNSGKKIFTGTTLTKKWWKKELEIIKSLPSSKIKDTDLVVLSSFKKISAEYRFLMHLNNVVSYSRYDENEFDVNEEIIDFAKSNVYFPDEMYTIDIAVLPKGDFKFLEINSFSSAGLYEMDFKKIVKYINDKF